MYTHFIVHCIPCDIPHEVLIFNLCHTHMQALFSSLTRSKGPLGNNAYQPVILRKLGLFPNKGPRKPKHTLMVLQVNVSPCKHSKQITGEKSTSAFSCNCHKVVSESLANANPRVKQHMNATETLDLRQAVVSTGTSNTHTRGLSDKHTWCLHLWSFFLNFAKIIVCLIFPHFFFRNHS